MYVCFKECFNCLKWCVLVHHRSRSGVKALALMVEKIPEAMDSLLNRAVSVEKYDPTNVKCELKLDFGYAADIFQNLFDSRQV